MPQASSLTLEQLHEAAKAVGVDVDRIRPRADSGEPVENGAYVKSTHMNSDGRRTDRNRRLAALYDRADAECNLIVSLYFDGLSLSKIATMLGRSIDYISRVFHSPKAKLIVNDFKRTRNELATELQDRTAYAAQTALDNIIELAQDSGNDSVRFKASEYLVEKAREDAGLAQKTSANKIQVNITSDNLQLIMSTIKEVDTFEQSTPVEVAAEPA